MILYGAYTSYNPLVAEYKKVRPDGKIYLATDMNIGWADRLEHESPQYDFLIKSCDVVGASCRATQKYLSAKWSVPVELFRNSFYNFANISFDNLFEGKENIILTVARIGTYQKRNEIMLEAFAKVADKIPTWKMRLVGTIEEKFQPYIEKYFERFPDLKDRVNFVGLVEDKTELLAEYKRAKIFVEVGGDEKILSAGMKHAASYGRREFDMEKIVARLNYLLFGG